MLERLPRLIGRRLQGKGPGLDQTIYFDRNHSGCPETLVLTSPILSDGEAIPVRYTGDGEKLSPPLAWSGVPPAAQSLVLVVEDADSPTPSPIVHALVIDLPATKGKLDEGSLRSPGSAGGDFTLGKNTFMRTAYLPPDPPPGGGLHRYVFQLYALDRPTGLNKGAGRSALKEALRGHVPSRGCLVATYERA